MTIETIRKYFYENKDYVIRIRENSEDIVYYNGIKAFKINKTKDANEASLEIIPNVFLINDATIKSLKATSKTDEEIRTKVITYLVENRSLIKDLLQIKDNAYIKFKESTSDKYSQETKQKNLQEIKNYLNKNTEFSNFFNLSDTYKQFLKPNWEIDNLPEIEYDIMDCFVYKYKNCGFTKPDFNLFTSKKIPLKDIFIDSNNNLLLTPNTTDLVIKKVIEKYEQISFEDEKYYQHQFMTSPYIFNKLLEFNHSFPFEQEYYTYDKQDDKQESKENISTITRSDRGRIDNIFITPTSSNKADLYLIELKYGPKVLSGTNGIKKHLEDINKLINDSYYLIFKQKLLNRINYRLDTLRSFTSNGPNNITDFNSINFYTIIGSNSLPNYSIDTIKKELKKINNKGEITNLLTTISNNKNINTVKFFLDDTNYDLVNKKITITDSPLKQLD